MKSFAWIMNDVAEDIEVSHKDLLRAFKWLVKRNIKLDNKLQLVELKKLSIMIKRYEKDFKEFYDKSY